MSHTKARHSSQQTQPPLHLEMEAAHAVIAVGVTMEKVMDLLKGINIRKTTVPDDVIPRTLKDCARELSTPLSIHGLPGEHLALSVKKAQDMPVHKKSSKTESGNYRSFCL